MKGVQITYHFQGHDARVGDVDGAFHVRSVVFVLPKNLEVGDFQSLQGVETCNQSTVSYPKLNFQITVTRHYVPFMVIVLS